MAVIKTKPTSPGRRSMVRVVHPHLYKGDPYQPLVESQSNTGGRNHHGRITTRHRGGGQRQHYRLIDFRRDKDGIPGKVERVEYDPNRTAHIALLLYVGRRSAATSSRPRAWWLEMWCCPVVKRRFVWAIAFHCATSRSAPPCIVSSCSRAKARSLHAVLVRPCNWVAREGAYATIRLRSGEMRKVPADCRAVMGEVSNTEHNLEQIGKAGAVRWRGKRPTVARRGDEPRRSSTWWW